MPDFNAQFHPLASDYRHDRALARAASIEVRLRIAAGENELKVVREIAMETYPAYIAEAWNVWHPRLRLFLTPAEAIEIDLLIVDSSR